MTKAKEMKYPWLDLKTSMSAWVGKKLIKWSKECHSHPPGYTYDEWMALIYMHGCTLLRYGDSRYPEDIVVHYWYFDEEDASACEAKASMQWVTDHFHTLWD